MPLARPHSRCLRELEPKLAFGVEPSSRRFRLRLARYPALGLAVADFVERHPALARVDLLDVGVGSGRSMRYIERHECAGRIRFFGVDSSDRRLESVYRAESWTLSRADIEIGLPFPAATFDIVLCEQVLEHLRRPERGVHEIARVLRPHGLLVAGVPTSLPGVRWIRERAVPAIDRWFSIGRGHVQAFSLGSFLDLLLRSGHFRMLRARGFRIVSGGPLGFLEDRRWWWRLNSWFGEKVPGLCIEVQLLLERRRPMESPPSVR
jgi:SAM-dependent methyltransferase